MIESIRYRGAVFGRHLGQSSIACITAMTQGDFSSVTAAHWKVALITGVLAGGLAVMFSFTPIFRRYNPTASFALIAFIGTLVADRLAHPSHFGGAWAEALATAAGAVVISLLISFAPIASAVERMEKPSFHRKRPPAT